MKAEPDAKPSPDANLGVVVIGKNEGERLKRCIRSVRSQDGPVVYVDSGSTDGSPQWVTEQGFSVVTLPAGTRFTAARARNGGFVHLQEQVPVLHYVQFVDGDCEVAPGWLTHAQAYLSANPHVVAVFGRRRERFPDRSIYNLLCDMEWDVPLGEVGAFGGDVMIRADALAASGGYRADLIAGEEPELCIRLRRQGWKIVRLDHEMTLHDAALTRFGQWWKRSRRSGYAFAQGASLHGAGPERHWLWETRRALIWAGLLPAACLALSIALFPWGLLSWALFPLQVLRRWLSRRGDRKALQRALFEILARFAEAQGALQFYSDRWRTAQRDLIEYK